MKTHKHLFVKISDKAVGDEWETVFMCECKMTQTFIDLPDGEYNKSLPASFSMEEL